MFSEEELLACLRRRTLVFREWRRALVRIEGDWAPAEDNPRVLPHEQQLEGDVERLGAETHLPLDETLLA